MLRARNILIILVVNYILALFISSVLELGIDDQTAQTVMTDIRTAADMSLQQTQTIDSYIANPSGSPDNLEMPLSNGDGFAPINVFQGLFGLDTSNPASSESLFQTLYGGTSFKSLASQTGRMTVPVQYFDPSTGASYWYYIPKITEIGMDMLSGTHLSSYVTDASGAPVSNVRAQQIFTAYGIESHIHQENGSYYYNTPLSLGVTYLNPTFLSYLFENNMDLLMRLKYNGTYNLNTPAGGNGVLQGSTYASRIKGSLTSDNPINDGSFTYLRGATNTSADSSVQSFQGVLPTITYKVIDMYNPANDPLLVDLFGAYTGSFTTKAAYLQSLDQGDINPVTGAPYQTKPIVVAQVTFYADVIVPYSTLLIRGLRSAVASSPNYIDIQPDASDVAGPDGSRQIEYTTYFAVTP